MEEKRRMKELLKRALEELGFSEKEALVYLELTRSGKGTPQEIAERTGLSSAFVYRTLRRLMEEGLVLRISDRPQLYEIIDPRSTLSNILKKKAMEIERLSEKIPNLDSLLEKELEFREAGTGVGIYRAVNIVESVSSLLREARDHVLLALDLKYLKEVRRPLRNSASRGLVMDIVLYGEGDLSLRDEGPGFWEIRRRSVPSLNLAIADRDLGIAFNPRYRYALVIEDPLLIDTLSMTFYHILWKPSYKVFVKSPPRNTTLVVRYLFRAAELVRMFSKSREVEVVVEGYDRHGRFLRIRGKPVEVFSNSYDVVYYLRVIDEGGRSLTIGDRGAIKEDVATEKIYIIVK